MNPMFYRRFADAHAERSPHLRNFLFAYLIGGGICLLSQLLTELYRSVGGAEPDAAKTLSSVTLIFLAALLSALGIFDRIAKVAGAGTLVPITGFANAVVSPAIDARAEGLILGVGAKIFTVAGPVLLYGSLAGSLYGIIFWFLSVL